MWVRHPCRHRSEVQNSLVKIAPFYAPQPGPPPARKKAEFNRISRIPARRSSSGNARFDRNCRKQVTRGRMPAPIPILNTPYAIERSLDSSPPPARAPLLGSSPSPPSGRPKGASDTSVPQPALVLSRGATKYRSSGPHGAPRAPSYNRRFRQRFPRPTGHLQGGPAGAP